MECFDCGKPYMSGLSFVYTGKILLCKQCSDRVVLQRKKSFIIGDDSKP